MADRDLKEIYDDNPATLFAPTTLLYGFDSPYGAADDTGIKYEDLVTTARTLHVMPAPRGSADGNGSLTSPFALPSQAYAEAVALSVSNTSPVKIKTWAGPYTESVDLPLVRPGLFSEFDDGVRLNMGANYLTAAGWDGVAGAFTGITGFKPLVFGGVNVSIPSDGIASWTAENNNWNAASNTVLIVSNNESTNSIFTQINSEISINSIQGFDEVHDNGAGQSVFSVSTTGWQPKTINLTGGSNYNQFSIAAEGTSEINAVITNAFVNDFTAETNAPGGVATLTCRPGQIGSFTPSTSGGGTTPRLIMQEWAGVETANGDMIDRNYSPFVNGDVASDAQLNFKFQFGASVVTVGLGTKEIFFPVAAIADNSVGFTPQGGPILCAGGVFQGSSHNYLVGDIPLRGAKSIVDIFLEGFVTGISMSTMEITLNTAQWAALGDLDDANYNTGNVTVSTAPDNTLVRVSLMPILGDLTPIAGSPIAIGDTFGIDISSSTSATKIFYATGIRVLYQ